MPAILILVLFQNTWPSPIVTTKELFCVIFLQHSTNFFNFQYELPLWQASGRCHRFFSALRPRQPPYGNARLGSPMRTKSCNLLPFKRLRHFSSRNKLWNPVCDVDRSKTYRVAVYVRIANWPPGYLGFRVNSSASSFWSLKTELYRQEWKSRRRALHDQSRET